MTCQNNDLIYVATCPSFNTEYIGGKEKAQLKFVTGFDYTDSVIANPIINN